MQPFDQITSRDNAVFPFKQLTSYSRTFMVDWREAEDRIVTAFLSAAGRPANETTWHWDETARAGKFVSRGRHFPTGLPGLSAQHAAVSTLQAIYAGSHSIRFLNHVTQGDTAWFVVETPATWSALEAANPLVRWFFTPLEYLGDIFEASFDELSAAARLFEAGKPPPRPASATAVRKPEVAAVAPESREKIFLDHCRTRLDAERAKSPLVPAADRLKIPAPLARLGDHPLRIVYDEQPVLFQHGRVVWAHVVQANSQLFKMGDIDLPAAFVFSLDPFFDVEWQLLGNIAARLFALKGAVNPDPADANLARIITSESEMVFNLPVPRQHAAGKEVFFTAAMVHRNHLPNWILGATLVPFLVAPEKTRASMILPHRYWPRKLW